MRKTKGTNLIMIRTENLSPHPDNPRLDVGDVTELAESVKKNGVMQNLTVIPEEALTLPPEEQKAVYLHGKDEHYIVLIGHRRLAASKAAGLEEVPCKVVSKISKREQVSIMLEENMQRTDLTIYEQAQGFQMMLDLGETAETIAEKTGFSKTTVKHRLNIAKLDRDTLKRKAEDNSFQLSFTDLYELEKISDVDKRNEILKKATSSNNIVYLVQKEVRNENFQKWQEKMEAFLEKAGVRKLEDDEEDFLTKELVTLIEPGYKLKAGALPLPEDKGDLRYKFYRYYGGSGGYVCIYKCTKKKEKPLAEVQKEQRDEKNSRKVNGMWNKMKLERMEFLKIAIEKTFVPDPQKIKISDLQNDLLRKLVNRCAVGDYRRLMEFFAGTQYWEIDDNEKKRLQEKIDGLPIVYMLLIFAEKDAGMHCPNMGKAVYNASRAVRVLALEGILKEFGFSYSDPQYYKVSDGTHELYVKNEVE